MPHSLRLGRLPPHPTQKNANATLAKHEEMNATLALHGAASATLTHTATLALNEQVKATLALHEVLLPANALTCGQGRAPQKKQRRTVQNIVAMQRGKL